jgi:tol-pal system-associated acyl-CoA thioesterase
MKHHYQLPVHIYVEDTDYTGIVYHANHLKFMERARSEWLLHLGYSLTEMEKAGFIFVIFKVEVKYLQPLRLHDHIEVTAAISHFGKSSMTFVQTIKSKNDSTTYTEGEVVVVCIDKITLRPKPIPLSLREKLS